MSGRTPADQVQSAIAKYVVDELNSGLGYHLRSLECDNDEDDDPDATLIVKDAEGRRFEVQIDVDVTELTAELVARRAQQVAEYRAAMQRAQARSTA